MKPYHRRPEAVNLVIEEVSEDIERMRKSPLPVKTEHYVRLRGEKPIKTKSYRMSPRQINILKDEIKRLLDLGEIEIGQPDFTSPLILVESP
ncbi:hypothetical protein TNIN_403221 [Trichonephila inaurata madagascariensis]|uniref:Uncharacterized protein n=1 Tax=Trichonephila inaurata madagascariensis TaxID=2747483 RepID=A0A8X6WLJ3_9ARAC|nr:hypothetical protein TNIN_403221 [Trichonephila inaurata madagascariensis]